MKTYTEYLWFNTEKVREDINITRQVKEVLKKSEIQEGLLVISTMHASAGVYIDDYEPEVKEDQNAIQEYSATYKEQATSEKAGEKQQKNISGSQHVVIPITYEKMDLGLWQQILYAEFDGQRKKKIVIKVIGE